MVQSKTFAADSEAVHLNLAALSSIRDHARSLNRRVAQSLPWFDGLGLYFFINDDMRWNIFDISLVACFNALKFIEEWNTQNKQIEQGRGAKSQSWPVCSLLSGYFLRGWDHILLRHVLRGSCEGGTFQYCVGRFLDRGTHITHQDSLSIEVYLSRSKQPCLTM